MGEKPGKELGMDEARDLDRDCAVQRALEAGGIKGIILEKGKEDGKVTANAVVSLTPDQLVTLIGNTLESEKRTVYAVSLGLLGAAMKFERKGDSLAIQCRDELSAIVGLETLQSLHEIFTEACLLYPDGAQEETNHTTH